MLDSVNVQSNSEIETNKLKSTATVTLRGSDGEDAMEAAMGVGPVDATFKAISPYLPRSPLDLP